MFLDMVLFLCRLMRLAGKPAAISTLIAGLDPAIHRLREESFLRRRWMPGSSPGMTTQRSLLSSFRLDAVGVDEPGPVRDLALELAAQDRTGREIGGDIELGEPL